MKRAVQVTERGFEVEIDGKRQLLLTERGFEVEIDGKRQLLSEDQSRFLKAVVRSMRREDVESLQGKGNFRLSADPEAVATRMGWTKERVMEVAGQLQALGVLGVLDDRSGRIS